MITIFFRTHNVSFPDGVQVRGVRAVLQRGQSCAQFVVYALSAVVQPLHIQQVSDHVDSCGGRRKVKQTGFCTGKHTVQKTKSFQAGVNKYTTEYGWRKSEAN